MRKTMTPLLVTVLVVYSAQQLLMPILAPLSRELSLTETQLGLVVTVAAATLTIASPLWGRALDRLGLRTVLLAGLGLATSGLAGFAAVAAIGLDGTSGPALTFGLMLATRSLLFGAGIAAIPVAALAVAGTVTTNETDRTRVVGLVGAAQGLSLVLGPAAGGTLALVSLMLPLYVAPVLPLLLAGWVLTAVPGVTPARPEAERPAKIRPWQAHLWPLFAIGFLLYLSLSLVQVIIGFLVADRLGLDPQATAGAVGVVLFVSGLVLVAVQGAVVPKLGWPARRLLRTGIPITIAAFALLALAGQLWTMTAAFAVLSLGLGLAIPGFTTAPTLAVGPDQQGSVAGLVNATIGATFVAGPLLGTALYELQPVAPVLAALGSVTAALGLTWGAPAAHRIGEKAVASAAG
ncbi:putative MFS family arabinose efflux permease [Amycolatopsis cihanbeyliensis]|uniref:Putative MFS family arabinose efflux permease n=2 Tax=Amycolatopsis cihanbeyliensis TaxID=1128664 RepID=A0A542DBT6_AMYCI|nr:putative MFS family arabinose efflux permease [Amycolatopsis cihanbeyliensis]